jgi:CheY-like chemotaxis protein
MSYGPVESRSTTAERITVAVGRLDDETSECYAEWREACAMVDDAYCEWLCAPADEQSAAFAAYRAALDHEESLAAVYRAVIDRVGQGDQSRPIGAEPSAAQGVPGPRGDGVRVMVADRDGFARRMLQRVLEEAGEVMSVTEARDGREALELVRQDPPDVLLVEIGMPPGGGVELIRVLQGILPQMRAVTISAGADWDLAVLAALRAGAIGHIDKDTAPDQIARLVLLAAGGEAVVPGRLLTRLLASWRIAPPAADDRGAAA